MKQGEVINPPAPVGIFGVRHVQILLQVLFYIISFGNEVSLSATLNGLLRDRKFMDEVTQSKLSLLVQCYLLGFIITLPLGGFVCKRFGFKWPMVIFMSIISAATLNIPTMTKIFGPNGLMACRTIQGLCSGLLFPMPADAISKWVPVKERTTLGTAVYASGILGLAISFFAGQLFPSSGLGWSFVYLQLGFLSIIWVVLMVVFGADSPEQYPRITDSELEYIVYNRGHVAINKKVKTPWRQILCSMPFWAIVVAQLGASWLLFVVSSNLPMFMVIKFNYRATNNIFAVINLITWILSFAISGIAQMLINEERTTIGQSRKLFNTLGTSIPAFFSILLMFDIVSSEYIGIAIWAIISVCSVGTICGSKLNVNDITSNFAPIIFGTATLISTVFMMISITVVSYHGFDDWTFIFGFTAILLIVTNLFYLKFGSGEEQEWSIYEDNADEEIDLSKSTSRASVDEGKYLLYVRKQ